MTSLVGYQHWFWIVPERSVDPKVDKLLPVINCYLDEIVEACHHLCLVRHSLERMKVGSPVGSKQSLD